MARPAERRARYEDLLRLPEHLVGELIAGELIVSPRPAPRHALASSTLGAELGGPFQRGRGGPGGWWILDEPEVHLVADGAAPNVVVPDLAGWRRERLTAMPETAFFEVVPDWVCEVISPATGRLDRAVKLPLYAAAGVNHAWIVDPASRTLEVLGRDGGGWRVLRSFGGDDLARAEPFEALELDLLALWGETRSSG